MSSRSKVDVQPQYTIKRFSNDSYLLNEVSFYRSVPWACPTLLACRHNYMLIETLQPAKDIPEWKPYNDILKMLERLHKQYQIHHRDIHIDNILYHPERGPLIIDWELAVKAPSNFSYDIYGPIKSGIEQPNGQRGIPMWLGANHKKSLGVLWK